MKKKLLAQVWSIIMKYIHSQNNCFLVKRFMLLCLHSVPRIYVTRESFEWVSPPNIASSMTVFLND